MTSTVLAFAIPTAVQLEQLRRIRWAVRLTLLAGVAASVAANILHADDNPISQTIASWPPLALLLNVELISRVPVHRRSLAALRLVATTGIAGIAAWVSYWHMAGVAARYGEHGASAYLLPFSVDGLIVVASISLVELAALIRTIENTPVPVPAGPTGQPEPTNVPIGQTQNDQPNTTTEEDQIVPSGQSAEDDSVPAEVVDTPDQPVTADLLSLARVAATAHRRATGKDITRDELRAALRVATATASELLRRLRDDNRTEAATPEPPVTPAGPATPAIPGLASPVIARPGVVPVVENAFGRPTNRSAGEVAG